jgi:hypothetical protein
VARNRVVESAFSVLGLTPASASKDDVVAARRRLARELHPDREGGDPSLMADVNHAVDVALAHIEGRTQTRVSNEPSLADERMPMRQSVQRDHPSFTIDVLPVEAWEALRIVTTWIGELVDEDPPYLLEVRLDVPHAAWCRLELVPDAGATTVTVSVMRESPTASDVELIRDLWIDQLNRLDWQNLDSDQPRPW